VTGDYPLAETRTVVPEPGSWLDELLAEFDSVKDGLDTTPRVPAPRRPW
jgi:hypothetical protein